jgi:hypothetical protein
VPKRGAEVGGLLLGSIDRGGATVIRIQDFQPVECGYTRGPSYLFSGEEREKFEETCVNWRPDASRPDSRGYAVGFYRSHTRDGLSLEPEDIELMNSCFPDPSEVALLVKPFATKASPAGFFFRENGVFQETTPSEFPFRRHELTGAEPPEHRPLTERRSRDAPTLVRAAPEAPEDMAGHTEGNQGLAAGLETAGHSGNEYAVATPPRSRLGAWMIIPLSFLFLLLGVALGALAELNVGPRIVAAGATDYSLSMAVVKSGDTLSLRWNGDAPLIRKANRGVLEIHDGDYAKVTDLDVFQLRNGTIIFRNQTGSVNFRLTVYLNPNLSVSENLGWRQ